MSCAHVVFLFLFFGLLYTWYISRSGARACAAVPLIVEMSFLHCESLAFDWCGAYVNERIMAMLIITALEKPDNSSSNNAFLPVTE